MEKELQLLEFSKTLEDYPGHYLLKYEQEHLNSLLSQLHGYFLVQLGIFNNYNLQSVSTMMNRIYVGRGADHPQLCVVEANFSELPFQSESIDAFLLPHTLEFASSPDKLLNEIYHILIPGGKLIIFGFNPYSFLGLTKLFKSAKNRPWFGKLYSSGHVKFWLRASGFSLDNQKSFCFRPPLTNKNWLKKLFFLEPVGQFCYPFLGNIYMLVAQKKTVSLQPVKLKIFSKKIPVTRGFPEPSTNKGL